MFDDFGRLSEQGRRQLPATPERNFGFGFSDRGQGVDQPHTLRTPSAQAYGVGSWPGF